MVPGLICWGANIFWTNQIELYRDCGRNKTLMRDAAGLSGLEFAMEKLSASNAEIDGVTDYRSSTDGCV